LRPGRRSRLEGNRQILEEIGVPRRLPLQRFPLILDGA
jgi:hypothetical protein